MEKLNNWIMKYKGKGGFFSDFNPKEWLKLAGVE